MKRRGQLTPEMRKSVDRLALEHHRDDTIKLQRTARSVVKIGCKGAMMLCALLIRTATGKIREENRHE